MGGESEVKQNVCKEEGSINEVEVGIDENNKTEEFTSSDELLRQKVNCCDNKVLLVKTICCGQILSLMLSSTGTSATTLGTIYNIRTPCFNAFTMYTLLAFTFGIYTMQSKNFIPLVRNHGWKYVIVAILDVEANYLLTKAYSYTTLTSVQLCDSFTIPTVMIISFIFLRVRYKIIHYIGVILCISGAVCLIFTDGGDKKGNASNEIVGDVMALCAAVLYGTSQVGQEYLVKKYSWKEYLGMIGMIGFVISGIQTAAVEYKDLSEICWNWQIGLIFFAFAVCQFVYYTVMPLVMKLSSATVVNLSLLTSDLYTLIIGLFVFNYKFSYMYFVAFGGIIAGLITYNLKPTPTAAPRKKKKRKVVFTESVTVSKFTDGRWYTLFTRKNNKNTPLLNGNNNINYSQL